MEFGEGADDVGGFGTGDDFEGLGGTNEATRGPGGFGIGGGVREYDGVASVGDGTR